MLLLKYKFAKIIYSYYRDLPLNGSCNAHCQIFRVLNEDYHYIRELT